MAHLFWLTATHKLLFRIFTGNQLSTYEKNILNISWAGYDLFRF